MSDSPIDVCRLSPDDSDAMHAMLDLFATAFDDDANYVGKRPDRTYLSELLGNAHFIALTATSEERLIGGLAAYVLPKFEQARSEVYIYDLAVDERYRRCGVATALIDALKPIARENGAWVIFVQADHGDDPAISLYSKLGQREDVLHFDIAPD